MPRPALPAFIVWHFESERAVRATSATRLKLQASPGGLGLQKANSIWDPIKVIESSKDTPSLIKLK